MHSSNLLLALPMLQLALAVPLATPSKTITVTKDPTVTDTSTITNDFVGGCIPTTVLATETVIDTSVVPITVATYAKIAPNSKRADSATETVTTTVYPTTFPNPSGQCEDDEWLFIPGSWEPCVLTSKVDDKGSTEYLCGITEFQYTTKTRFDILTTVSGELSTTIVDTSPTIVDTSTTIVDTSTTTKLQGTTVEVQTVVVVTAPVTTKATTVYATSLSTVAITPAPTTTTTVPV